MRRWIGVLALALSGVACDGGDEALVVVTLDATTPLASVSRLAVDATVGATTRSFDVTPKAAIAIPPSYDFGVRVPAKLGKRVDFVVTAYAGASSLGSSMGGVAIAGGKRANVTLTFGAAPSDGGVDLVDLAAPPGSDLTANPDLVPGCDETSCPPCSDCSVSGTCTKLVISADDPLGQPCEGANTCSATGACKIRLGFACTPATEDNCVSGHCVDGVCCNVGAAACGECKQCNQVGHEGTCTDAVDGTDPDSECGASYNCRSGHCASNCNCDGSPDGGTAPCNNLPDNTVGVPTTYTSLDCKQGYYCIGNGYTCVQKRCSGSCGYNVECGNSSCPYPSLMCSC